MAQTTALSRVSMAEGSLDNPVDLEIQAKKQTPLQPQLRGWV